MMNDWQSERGQQLRLPFAQLRADSPEPFGESPRTHHAGRHRLAERFLTDILGLSWADAHKEAGKWEHVISPDVEQAMIRVLHDPTTCPHGNPIPGSDYHAPDTVSLNALAVGAPFTVSRIPEELEFAPGVLEFLETSSLVPGQSGVVTAASPDGTCDGVRPRFFQPSIRPASIRAGQRLSSYKTHK